MFKTLRKILGTILIVGSVALGIYVGLWVLFIGGIVQIVNSITPEVHSMGIAIGVLKVVFANAVGAFTFWVSALIGAILLSD